MLSPADHICQLEHCVRTQMDVIDQLRAENRRLLDWIMGDGPDALLALQKVYSDPKTSEPNVIKAASAALSFERSKPAAEVVVYADFKERVRNARLKADAKLRAQWALEDQAKTIEGTVLGSSLASDHGGDPLGPDPAA
jgi:hypothetical protein